MTDTTPLAPPPPVKQPPRFIRAVKAMGDRRMAAMFLLAFAAGLPMGATLGLLSAWLTTEGINSKTIGVLSLTTLGYAFKYLWAPLFATPRAVPGLNALGARRSWLLVLQLAIAALLCVYALVDPNANIGLVAFTALIVTLLSPTHDLILDGWRIEVARSEEDKDLMSALYQFGYKSAGFVTGFFALLMADYYGFTVVFLMIAGFMVLAISGTLIAPEPRNSRDVGARPSYYASVPGSYRQPAVIGVSLCYLISFLMIIIYVVRALSPEGANAGAFVRQQGPIIVLLTVVVPATIAAIVAYASKATAADLPLQIPGSSAGEAVTRTMFRAIFDPLIELISRLGWWVILVLALALTYRFTDAVWGVFAYPFYLGLEGDALGHTLTEVGIASKFFGVLATILGSLIGAILIATIGRMPVFFIGGIVAAVTNLLYADLAAGAAWLDGFLAITHLDAPMIAFAEWALAIQPNADPSAVDNGQRMARLMATIFMENIAGGLALVAMTAYLTSIVNPRFAVVQYALLASLTMLIGTLGRPWLGEIIDNNGFFDVFIVTFWLGGVAVILSIIEWIRQSRTPSTQQAMVLDQDG